MKNIILKPLLVSLLLTLSAFAYEASTINVNWIGYKTQAKAGVPGTFDSVKLDIQKSDDFKTFLNSAKVSIDSSSLNSKMKFRDTNIVTTLFKLSSAKEISAVVKKVNGDISKGSLDVEIMMNKNTKTIPMNYTVEANKLTATGSIDILDFAMNDSFAAFAAKCKPFHAGKTWTEVTVSFELPFTK